MAPRAALGPGVDDESIPYSPPFSAHLANLPYDVDEDQILEVFEKCKLKVLTIRLMKEESGRLRGFGYADFADRSSLVEALSLNDVQVNNRSMRIDLASGAGKDGDRRGGGGFGDRDRGGREDDPNAGRSEADNDWRRGPPPPPRDDDRRNGGDDRRGGGGFDRYERSDRDRGGFGGGFSRDRDERGGGRSYGFGRDRDDDRGGDRYGDRRRSPEPQKERPRLNLAPRSKPAEEEGGEQRKESTRPNPFGAAKPVDTTARESEGSKPAESAPAPRAPASNPFGAAKPIDTAQREKEIEDKLGKLDVSKESSDKPSAYRPPGARDRPDDRRDDRRDDRGGGSSYRRDDRGGYDRRDDRGGYDRDRRDDRGGYDRDRRGGDYGRRDDRRDDRGGGGRDDRGGYDRRDDRGGYDRRDDRGSGYDRDRRDDRGYDRDRRDDRGYERESERRDERGGDEGKSREGEKEQPAMKKYEEPKAPNLVSANPYAHLKDEAESASENED